MAEEREKEKEKERENGQILSPPQSILLFKKRTRFRPDLSVCHCCRLRFPSKNIREKLQTLKSQWRIVLLCKTCLCAIQSAKICSYCFLRFSEMEEFFFDCHRCFSRIHCSCVPYHCYYNSPSQLDPDSFTCIDCCAIPKSWARNPNFNGSLRILRYLCSKNLNPAVESKKVVENSRDLSGKVEVRTKEEKIESEVKSFNVEQRSFPEGLSDGMMLMKCEEGIEEKFFKFEQDSGILDRFSKKYFRRRLTSKGVVGGKAIGFVDSR